ncbi:Zinc transporter ZIP2 [Aphelenchoides fujianensis]|nr:Zinc transporter ZIP2 [Aphelenchoides fujianensis]
MLLQAILIAVILLSSLIASLAPIKADLRLVDRSNAGETSQQGETAESTPPLYISCLSCFAGGTFLSVIFLHLLPDAHVFLSTVQQAGSWVTTYPIVELIALFGFFVVYLVEILSDTCFVHGPHDQSLVTKNPGILQRKLFLVINRKCSVSERRSASVRSEDNCAIHSGGHEHPHAGTSERGSTTPGFIEWQHDEEHRNALIARTISFICALVLHSAVEGFSFGVQTNPTSIISLFLGIVVHRSVVAFSVGTRLVNCHPQQKKLVVGLAVIFAISSPAFAVVGLLLRSSAINFELKAQLSTTLISFSIGTILYISFFEMLVPERASGTGEQYKFLSMVLGCFIIAMVSWLF